MRTMNEIEKLTKDFSDARGRLSDIVLACQKEMDEAKRLYLPRIKKAVEAAAEKQQKLYSAIDAAPEFFQKPRTVVMHGIRVGYMKGKGEITWADEAQVLKLIHKHFPDMVDMLIKTTEKPIKLGLAGLPAADLKKLGVTVSDDGDVVVIKSTDSEIDKLVSALLKEDEIKEVSEIRRGEREAA